LIAATVDFPHCLEQFMIPRFATDSSRLESQWQADKDTVQSRDTELYHLRWEAKKALSRAA
jgi:hypothetical protein